jgi:hypothetical protein
VTGKLPEPAETWRAIDLYLGLAHDRNLPGAVAERLVRLRATPEEAFYACGAFERTGERLALRLGNRFYPHMKLVLEPSPDGPCVFRVDTHDRHFLDLVGAAEPALAELIDRNAAIARAIEDGWSAAGLRTTREHWRDALARWHASRP